MRWLSIVFALFVGGLSAQTKIQYSNWTFDLPPTLEKQSETAEALTLRTLKALPIKVGTVTVRAGRKSTTPLAKEVETVFTAVLAARKATEQPTDEEMELADGTKGLMRSAPLEGGGLLMVGVWGPKGGVNVLIGDAPDEIATEMIRTSVQLMQMNLQFAPVTGAAGGAAKAPGPAAPAAMPEPTPLEPDPSEGIDWGARRPLVRTLADGDAIDVKEALANFLAENRSLLGGVSPRKLDAKTALQRVGALLRLDRNEAAVRFLRTDKSLPTADAMQECAAFALVKGKPAHAVLSLYVAHERWPEDLRVQQNLAAVLAGLGAVDEAMALVDRLRAGRELAANDGPVSADALLTHTEAWCLMRYGKYAEAAAKLRPVVAAEPFFAEAALTLALLEDKLGKSPRMVFLAGSFRRGGGMIHPECGTGRNAIVDPPRGGEEDVVELAAEEFIDLARGKPGKLPVITLPSGIPASMAFCAWVEAQHPAWTAEMQALSQQLMKLSDRWKGAVPAGSPIAEWHAALDGMLSEDNSRLPELHALKRAAVRARDELSKAEDRTVLPLVDKIASIVKRYPKENEQMCREVEVAVRQAMDHLARFTAKAHTADRRLFRLWHQYATAIGASVSEATFRAYLDTHIRHVRRNTFYTHFLDVYKWTQLAKYADKCRKPGQSPGQAGNEDDALPDCNEEQKKHSLGVSMGPIGIEASCEGISIEAEAPLFVKFVTISVEASFNYDRTTTIYGGAKVNGKVPIVSSFTTSPSMKGGGYVTIRDGKVVDGGLRGEAKVTTSAGPLTHGYKTQRSLSFAGGPTNSGGRSFELSQFRR